MGCGNDVIRSVHATLNARITYLRAMSIGQSGRPEKSLAELRQIVSALVSGTPADAEKACLEHVKTGGHQHQPGAGDPRRSSAA